MHETRWEHFAHDADIGVRGLGPTKAEAFAQAALALTGVVTDPATVAAGTALTISCSAPDDAVLLIDWLNALIYQMATRHMLFGHFDVTIDDHQLQATVWGEAVEQARHHPAVEVKGATFTAVAVERAPNGTWHAQCVVDV